ncbi:MAG: hypothetical protein WA890_27860 [Micromonospora sp.]
MADDRSGGRVRRQLWDLGRFAVVLTAPLLVRLANQDKRFVWTLQEVRGHARDRPPSGGDAEMANLFRTEAWFGLAMVPLAVYILAAQRRRDSPSPTVFETIMTVAATLGMFTLGMVLASGLKWALSQYFKPDLDRRLCPPGTREIRRNPQRSGLLAWLCLPSVLDAVFALTLASCMSPSFYP